MLLLAKASVAQTLLSVLWQVAVPDPANPEQQKQKTPLELSGVITTAIG
jgi:hypothetical protein